MMDLGFYGSLALFFMLAEVFVGLYVWWQIARIENRAPDPNRPPPFTVVITGGPHPTAHIPGGGGAARSVSAGQSHAQMCGPMDEKESG